MALPARQGLVALAAALLLAGCEFASLGGDEDRSVADGGAEVRLFGSDLRLPPSATNIRVRERRFQDELQWVRFDAPLADARAFGEALIGRRLAPGEDPGLRPGGELDWWPGAYPPGGEGGGRREAAAATAIVLQPRGDRATVWVRTIILS